MIVLAFDTAMAACSAAVYDAGRNLVLAQRFLVMAKGHADAIAPLIRDVVDEAGIAFSEIGRIGVTVGPGTFTGVRTGISMARGLGVSLNIPIAGIDTLTAIALNAADEEVPVAVAADARRGDVYFGLFDRGVTMLQTPRVLAAADAAENLPDSPLSVVGTGAELLMAAAGGKMLTRSDAGDLPRAAIFIRRLAAMTPGIAPPEPLYLRPPDAKPQERTLCQRRLFSIEPAGAVAAIVIAALHAECFDNPWGAAEIVRLMAMPGATTLIASDSEEPAAFLISRQGADEAEILTLGTRPFARRQGAARALVVKLQDTLVRNGARSLFIEVAKSNEPAQRLYRGLGFIAAGTRKRYYERPGGTSEDALIMRKDFGT